VKHDDKSAHIVAEHHKSEVDAATTLMDKAIESTAHRDYVHAIELLKCSIDHLHAAEIIQRILKDLGRAIAER